MKKIAFVIIISLLAVFSCTDKDSVNGTDDNFDRKALLINLADNIILPGYENFYAEIISLEEATTDFSTVTNQENLTKLRTAWKNAYVSWQYISFFQIGKAEEIAFNGFMNVYPVNVENIEANIKDGNYDLKAISMQDEQGFAALDYLLYGIAESDPEIIAAFSQEGGSSSYKTYLQDLIVRMKEMTSSILDDWKGGYRENFIINNGSSATSSLNKLVNDYVFHYEKFLRAGKVGIPAGVFSSSPLASKVEAFYAGDMSKELFMANLDAMQKFFNGIGSGSGSGTSINAYLKFLNTFKNGEDLSALINAQFYKIKEIASGLDSNFSSQIQTDNTLMLQTYDELQKNVIYLKVDMLQALSITVDYVDADGD